MKVRRRSGIWPVVLVAGLLLAACGDDDDDGGDAAGDGDAQRSIKVLNFAPVDNPSYSIPDLRAGAAARAEAINDAGGIDGVLIDLEFCNSNFDPNGEAACARRAVEEGFDAVVGSNALFPNTWPILERAQVPYIGGIGGTPQELRSPVAFPLSGAVPGWYQGAAALALERGAQRFSIVESPVGAAQFGARQMAAAVQQGGGELLRTVSAPVGAPDQATVAAQAAEGADAVLIAALPTDTIKVVQSLRQGGYGGRIAGPVVQFPDDTIAALGDAANGILVTGQTAPVSATDNPAIAQFIADMDAHDPGERKTERAIISWAAVDLFAKLVERIDGDVTAESVLAAMNDLSDPIETGVTAPYSTQGEPVLPDFPRVLNPTVTFLEVQDGRAIQVSDGFVNPFEILAQRGQR